MRFSICIPVYEMKGRGEEFLTHALQTIARQSLRDFEVVVSDNSLGDSLEKATKLFSLNINYFKNPLRGMAPNTNAAMNAAKGELIKILYQDDFLSGFESLQEISDNFKPEDQWLVTGCAHTTDGVIWENAHRPKYNDEIYLGNNTIGSPSVLTVRNEGKLLFDESLTWLLDCDLYKRYYDKYGAPKLLSAINVIIRTGKHQMTHQLSEERMLAEGEYLKTKFAMEENER